MQNVTAIKETYEQREARRARQAAALAAEHPELTPGNSPKQAAANMRTQLKAAFPGVTFSVRTRHFSGGNSIDVSCDALVELAITALEAEYTHAGPRPTVEDFRQGRLYNVSPIGGAEGSRHWSWESLIHRQLATMDVGGGS